MGISPFTMGCKSSKAAPSERGSQGAAKRTSMDSRTKRSSRGISPKPSSPSSSPYLGTKSTASYDTTSVQNDKLYKLLVSAQQGKVDGAVLVQKVRKFITVNPAFAAYQNPNTKSTPLHMAVRLLDLTDLSSAAAAIVPNLVTAYTAAVATRDAAGNLPLHYALAPTSHFGGGPRTSLTPRTAVVQALWTVAPKFALAYWNRNDVVYESGDATGGCSPLYRVLQTLPDDFVAHAATTVEYVHVLCHLAAGTEHYNTASKAFVSLGNTSDADKPLALLYRRFTRQFDAAEKFFDGDNSRDEVVQHRRRYKTAAGNTWKIIECLLQPHAPASSSWQIVHRAVQVETPPDLLRYIVETNAEDLTTADETGNLPLHHAAMSKPHSLSGAASSGGFPAFYTKFIVDELLYKFPDAASIPNADGKYPLTLAVQAGKQWIGGGIKSLYEAYPEALTQVKLNEHKVLRQALSMDVGSSNPNSPTVDDREEKLDSIIRDEQHDAIMLVQQETVDVPEVVFSMWAHEEDAGVQMLGCVALHRMVRNVNDPADTLRIALSAVAAIVNAMKAHPNEVIVQEKACQVLQSLAVVDGHREVSFVASGAVASIVGAMQAHVSDPGVQEEACTALAAVIRVGGAERATIVASVSGLTAMLNALAAHPDVVGVQVAALNALVMLTSFPRANLPDVPRSQTEALLLAARDKFPHECHAHVETLRSRLS